MKTMLITQLEISRLIPEQKRTPKSDPVDILDRFWNGTLIGQFTDLQLSWKVAFHLETRGNEIAGSGLLVGSGTYGESLEFSLLGDERVDPATNKKTIVMTLLNPLPKNQKAYMRFDLLNVHLKNSTMSARWRLPCMNPGECDCAGGNGMFIASKS